MDRIEPDKFEHVGTIANRIVSGDRLWDGKPISEPGIYRKIPMDDYHDQLTVGPSIS